MIQVRGLLSGGEWTEAQGLQTALSSMEEGHCLGSGGFSEFPVYNCGL